MPRLAKPAKGPISSPGGAYGPRILNGEYSFHNGLDFSYLYADVVGSSRVLSAHPGVVADVGYGALSGYYITVRIDERWLLRYMHLVGGSARVRPGDRVGYGTHLATMGSSGATAKHLHFDLFDLWKSSVEKRVDPAPYITLPYPESLEWASVVGAPIGSTEPVPEPVNRKAPTMHLLRTQDGTVTLVTDNGMANITQGSHLTLFERLLKSYPGFDTFNTAEREIMHGYIKAANTSDDAETAKILTALSQVKPVVDVSAIQDAIVAAIKAQGVEVDFAPVLAAIEAVNVNIDDQPTEFVLTPKE